MIATCLRCGARTRTTARMGSLKASCIACGGAVAWGHAAVLADDDEPLAPDASPAPFLRPQARAFVSPTRSALLEGLLEWLFR